MSENDYDTVDSVDWGWNKSLLTFISTFLHFLKVLSCILQLLVFTIICMVIVQTLCCVFFGGSMRRKT